MATSTNRAVFIHLPGQCEAVPAGLVTFLEEGVNSIASTFAYGARYLQRPNCMPVDPVSLALEGALPGEPGRRQPVNGLPLFGALRDAAPDAWGRRVIENRLQIPPNSLPESRYLDESGPNRFGALDFRQSVTSPEALGRLPRTVDLRYLVDAAARIEEGLPVPAALHELFAVGTMGGARPKAVVLHEGRMWLAKFPAKGDRYNVPAVERATLELARYCGLQVPALLGITLADGREVLLIERFDRVPMKGGFARRHVVSALTLLGVSELDSPSQSYGGIADAIGHHGASGAVAASRLELYKRMVFNVLVSNDDDHLRNHAFVWTGSGFELSPLYDVVPRPQFATDRYQHLGVGPRGRLAHLENALAAAGQFGLLPHAAAQAIDTVACGVREWRNLFEDEGISSSEIEAIASAFRRPRDIGFAAIEKLL